MSVETREVKGVLIIHPNFTRVTAVSGVEEFRDTMERSVERGHLAIAVDLAGVEYADSTMIGALISTFKKLSRQNGLMCLFNVGSELHEFFRQTVFDRFVEICRDEQSALELFGDRPKSTRKGLRRLFS